MIEGTSFSAGSPCVRVCVCVWKCCCCFSSHHCNSANQTKDDDDDDDNDV